MIVDWSGCSQAPLEVVMNTELSKRDMCHIFINNTSLSLQRPHSVLEMSKAAVQRPFVFFWIISRRNVSM